MQLFVTRIVLSQGTRKKKKGRGTPKMCIFKIVNGVLAEGFLIDGESCSSEKLIGSYQILATASLATQYMPYIAACLLFVTFLSNNFSDWRKTYDKFTNQ